MAHFYKNEPRNDLINSKLKLSTVFISLFLIFYCILKNNIVCSKNELENSSSVVNNMELWKLILVNYKNPTNEDYMNSIKLKSISTTKTINLMVDERIYNALKQMLDDTEKDWNKTSNMLHISYDRNTTKVI